MLKNIKIENFRGITNLEIEDFKQVNIFLGKNNSGKTSVLEAIAMLLGSPNIYTAVYLNELRDFQYIDFNSLFKKNSEPIKINGLIPHWQLSPTIEITRLQPGALAPNSPSSYETGGIEMKFSLGGNDPVNFYGIVFKNEKLEYTLPNTHKNLSHLLGRKEDFFQFIHVKFKETDYLNGLFSIIKYNLEFKLIEVLRLVDLSIKNIKTIGNTVLVDVGTNVPINVMGDGVRKVLGILVSIIQMSGGVVLIDEIENGLHFSSMKILWKAVLFAAKENNVQLFITTHNEEILKYLQEVVNEMEDKSIEKEIKCFVIRKSNDNKMKAFSYGIDALEKFSNGNFEIR